MSPLRVAFVALITLHGLIHLLGPAKAWGWATASRLQAPISSGAGLLWFGAAILMLAAAIGIALDVTRWWWVGLPAVLLSQALIVSAWSDAKAGTVVNVIIAIPLLVAALDTRTASFRSRFASDRAALLSRGSLAARLVTDADLASLPALMQTYLRRIGALGRPRVQSVAVTFKAKMRSSPTSPWMDATATQYESFAPLARLFHMKASRSGLPLDVFHRYVDGAATFQVRVAGLVSMVDAQGVALTNDETVTVMNDVLVMAPAAILDLPFTFEPLGDRTLLSTFRHVGFVVSAILTFDAAGDLVGFTSEDRAHARAGGAATWSTPISGYREVDGIRTPALVDANWIEPSGEWTYGRFEITSLAYNVAR